MQGFELDRRVLRRDNKEQRSLLVAEEQILAVNARDAAHEGARFFHGEHRRMRHRPVGDTEAIQIGEKVVRRGGGHGQAV